MTYKEWVQKHGHIDPVVRHILPPDKEVEQLTYKELIEKFGDKIRQVAGNFGIELSQDDLLDILERIYGVSDLPPFHKSHYDLHC